MQKSYEQKNTESGDHTIPGPIEWVGGVDGYLLLIDQTKLPGELTYLQCCDVESIWQAIKRLSVRGAPAIGIAAAYGVVIGIRDHLGRSSDEFLKKVNETCDDLASSRPTAVNLFWALDRMKNRARSLASIGCTNSADLVKSLLQEAQAIQAEDEAQCRAIGEFGESLIQDNMGILTHCNAGALATSAYGTALSPLYFSHNHGRSFRVYADETRPLLQGSRLTAWELQRAGIDVTLLCDDMAASLMKAGKIDLVITGADRIAANGDVANKIGTYGLAVLARAHEIPFYVAAPSSTFDLSISDGSAIPIEHRDPDEIRLGLSGNGLTAFPIAPPDVNCYNPAFDVTPAGLIHGLITEKGIIKPVNERQIRNVIANP